MNGFDCKITEQNSSAVLSVVKCQASKIHEHGNSVLKSLLQVGSSRITK